MEKILQTMKSGGHMNSNVYIPKDIWFQTDTKIQFQQQKIEFFLNLTKLLIDLQKTARTEDKIPLELESFIQKYELEWLNLKKERNVSLSKLTTEFNWNFKLG